MQKRHLGGIALFILVSLGLIAGGCTQRNQPRSGPADARDSSSPRPRGSAVANAPAGASSTPTQPPGGAQTQAPPDDPQQRRAAASAQRDHDAAYIREHYEKREVRIPMRDGARLFTSIYSPRDASQTYPILMMRTPYSVAPYGEERYRSSLGNGRAYAEEGFIFVYQDVRGCYMSEGEFVNMRPHIADKHPGDVDESTDAYDTIQWLLVNVPNHNGKVGQFGISYPGFYCSASMIDAHPALVAVSPQAPIADWFFDDFYHHGAFFLPHAFNFFSSFGRPRPEPTTSRNPRFDHGTPDGYQFFLDLGPLKNADALHFKGDVPFWTEITQHPNYDEFWQARNILPHLKNVAPAVMTVGGWFDAEDLYGALNTYQAIERQNPGIFNILVMGPWRHGGWARGTGERLGNIHFGARTSEHYQQQIELPFFRHYLKGEGEHGLSEAHVFETGANRWRTFDDWPPAEIESADLHLHPAGGLSFEPPAQSGYEEFISDPARPVPYTEAITIGMSAEYMTEDQRFAARRPDVLVFQTPPLTEPLTLAGPILAELWVSTSEADADWVVKLIDVYPPDARDYPDMTPGKRLGGYQMMVRSEAIRGRFRNSYERPEPFVPNEPTYVDLPLQDVLHTFEPGHRVMVQIQSTWFHMMDRNPQRFVPNIFEADEDDFVKATHRIYFGRPHATRLRVGILPAGSER